MTTALNKEARARVEKIYLINEMYSPNPAPNICSNDFCPMAPLYDSFLLITVCYLQLETTVHKATEQCTK